MSRWITVLFVLTVLGARFVTAQPERTYRAVVVSESADIVSFVRFGPDGLTLDRSYETGLYPMEIDGPHGVDVSPDGEHYYVSIGHGDPRGSLWKHRVRDDSLVGRTRLGLFPATLDVSPDGYRAYVVNFNLHGDRVPSSVSVVSTDPLVEIARIPTCTMPHGSRLSPDGSSHYSACMMDDLVVEIDTRSLAVSRHFGVREGHRSGRSGHPVPDPDRSGAPCRPTWAQPSADDRSVFVACHASNEILEIDREAWTLRRVLTAADGVYNLAVTSDGRLLVTTNKRDGSVSVYDLDTGAETVRLPTGRRIVHGVAVTPDDRYAFVSVEGVGSEPGSVAVIDLAGLTIAATLDVPSQAAGIDVLPD